MLSIPQDGMKEGCCIAANGDEASIFICVKVDTGATVANCSTSNCTSSLVPLQGVDLEAIEDDTIRSISIRTIGTIGEGNPIVEIVPGRVQ